MHGHGDHTWHVHPCLPPFLPPGGFCDGSCFCATRLYPLRRCGLSCVETDGRTSPSSWLIDNEQTHKSIKGGYFGACFVTRFKLFILDPEPILFGADIFLLLLIDKTLQRCGYKLVCVITFGKTSPNPHTPVRGWFFFEGGETTNMLWSDSRDFALGVKRRFPEHLLLGERKKKIQSREVQEEEAVWGSVDAAGAVRLLELVVEWEGSGWSVEPTD